MATLQAARRHPRHCREARGRPHAWGHRGHPPPPPPTPDMWGWGTGWGARGGGAHQGSAPRGRDDMARCHPAGVTAPAAHPQSAAATPGLQACAGTANTPRCCIIYKLEEQRARQQLQSPRGPPCPASRSHRARWHGGTTAPAARRDDRDKAACGAGRATGHPDVTLASPWMLRAAGAARGDVWCVPVSSAVASCQCLLPLQPALTTPARLLPPQPSYCRSNPLLSQPPSCHPTSFLSPRPARCHPSPLLPLCDPTADGAG